VSERLTPELPDGWEHLGREDAAALAPPDGAKGRVQRRVALTLGLGAGFLAATAGTSTAAAAGAAGAAGGGGGAGGTGAAATGLAGSLLAKKALVLGVAAAVGAGGGTAAYLEVRSERARSHAATTVPVPARAPVAGPVAPPAPEPPVIEEAREAAPDTLGEEGTLLDRARRDITRGQLREAGALLDRHAAQFPAGHLVEEREALLIRLLVREGRESEARARATRFRRAHPRSIQLPGIDAALREHR